MGMVTKKRQTKRLGTVKRVKIKNKGKCFIPKNALILDDEKENLKQIKELEELRNKELRKCECDLKTCDCFVKINISISCAKEPFFDEKYEINLLAIQQNDELKSK